MRRRAPAIRHTVFVLCLLLLCLSARVPAVSAGSGVAVLVTAVPERVPSGGEVVITVSVHALSATRLEGMSFHVRHSDSLLVLGAETPADEHFFLTSYIPESGFFSAAAAISDGLPEGDTWDLLILTCRVDPEASDDPFLSVSDSPDGTPDPKWCVFGLDENGNETDLTCDLSHASCFVSLVRPEDPAEDGETDTAEADPAEERTEPSEASAGSDVPAESVTNGADDGLPNEQVSDTQEQESPSEDARTSPDKASARTDRPVLPDRENTAETEEKTAEDALLMDSGKQADGVRSRQAVLIVSGAAVILLAASGAAIRNRRKH